jgi:multiple sugar transport system permease protein
MTDASSLAPAPVQGVAPSRYFGAAHMPQSPLRRRYRRMQAYADKKFNVLAAMPAAIVVTGVLALPVVVSVYMSFSVYNPTDPTFKWAGLLNYIRFWHDSNAHVALENTVIFSAAGSVGCLVLGLCLALLLGREMRGIRFFRTLFLTPLLMAGVATAEAWTSLLNTSSGWINWFLGLLGIPQPNWLASPSTAMLSCLIVDAWGGVPVVALIILAALLTMPREPIEAARMEGASEAEILRYIKIPAIKPVLAFCFMFQLVGHFQQFGLFIILTGGGPGLSTNVLNLYVYQSTFQFGELAYGAALAIVLVLAMAPILSAIFAVVLRRR